MYNNKFHKIIIFFIVAVYYSYILSYAYNYLGFMVMSLGLTMGLALIYEKSLTYFIELPLYRWILFYLVINLIWILLPNSYATPDNVSDIAISIVYIFTLATLFYFDDNRLSTARNAILFVTLLATFNHIYEFFNPEAFYSFDSKTKIIGRSTGFYPNSNGAGEALILGMILSYGVVPKKFKAVFLFTVLLGLIPTFSRSAIASWFVVVAIMTMTKAINKKTATTIGITLGITIAIVLPILIAFISFSLGEDAEAILARLDFFTSNTHSLSDGSASDRFIVMQAGFNYFAENPFFGAGHSATHHWEFDFSTHNIFLMNLAEYGLLGLFIYPLLILSILWKAEGEAKRTGVAFAVFLLFIGFASHNVLDGFHMLLAMAAMASWAYKSRNAQNNTISTY